MKKLLLAAAAAALSLTTVIAAPSPTTAHRIGPDWFLDESTLPFEALPGHEDTQRLWGKRRGAGYRIEVPADWNGDFVIYAHGFRGNGLELTVSNPSIRRHFLDNGFAWAASSYRSNGYAPGDGARDSHRLIDVFRTRVGRPDKVYITGHSMGGHVTAVAIERWPADFDGAVPMCGVMGDSELFDYYQDVYLLAEHFAGNDPQIPTAPDYFSNPAGFPATAAALGLPDALTPAGEQFQNAIEQLTGGDRPTFDEGWLGNVGILFPFLFQVAMTDDARGNVDTVYQLDNDPAISPEEQALNDAIPRVEADPRYRQPWGWNIDWRTGQDSPRIHGLFKVPVVSLHTLGELFVPFHMQQIYAERAESRGRGDMLVIRAIRDINHCGFTPGEQAQAFDDMVNWVENGVKPGGDDVLDRTAVAAADFGCVYTEIDRPGVPAC